MTVKRTLLASLLAGLSAGLLASAIGLGGAMAAGAPSHQRGPDCKRLALHVTANGRESLAAWLRDNQQTFGSVLHYSTLCSGNDGFMSPWFSRYVDRQDNRLIMRKGTRFWAQWPQ